MKALPRYEVTINEIHKYEKVFVVHAENERVAEKKAHERAEIIGAFDDAECISLDRETVAFKILDDEVPDDPVVRALAERVQRLLPVRCKEDISTIIGIARTEAEKQENTR